MKTEEKELCENTCVAKQIWSKLRLTKKNKCCKSFKDGKRCKRCPKR